MTNTPALQTNDAMRAHAVEVAKAFVMLAEADKNREATHSRIKDILSVPGIPTIANLSVEIYDAAVANYHTKLTNLTNAAVEANPEINIHAKAPRAESAKRAPTVFKAALNAYVAQIATEEGLTTPQDNDYFRIAAIRFNAISPQRPEGGRGSR